MSTWKDLLKDAIKDGVNEKTIDFAKVFGDYLVKEESHFDGKRKVVDKEKLTTNQVRKFFGEVKRQQMAGYTRSTFVLLKPKLAYAVGRANKNSKIKDFYEVLATAIDTVISDSIENKQEAFKNFIDLFEAIVAYHKYAEAGNAQK